MTAGALLYLCAMMYSESNFIRCDKDVEACTQSKDPEQCEVQLDLYKARPGEGYDTEESGPSEVLLDVQEPDVQEALLGQT